MPERRLIFEYTAPAGGPEDYFAVFREDDGTVTAIMGGASVPGYLFHGHEAGLTLPTEQWHKLIAALALEPDLWPGSEA